MCWRRFIFAPGAVYYMTFIPTVPHHSTLGEPVALAYVAPGAGTGTMSPISIDLGRVLEKETGTRTADGDM